MEYEDEVHSLKYKLNKFGNTTENQIRIIYEYYKQNPTNILDFSGSQANDDAIVQAFLNLEPDNVREFNAENCQFIIDGGLKLLSQQP